MDLLALQDQHLVEKTSLSRKLTLGGVTKAYPVYRVNLDLLYYNDQNDRIATWITQYNNDPTKPTLTELSGEAYNKVIQQFIIDSNPAAIEKTKNNIALVNQREPGVVLADGRIIDGNRRFTCLRLLRETDPLFSWFETVILSESAKDNQKQIKMLELAIQHGEEQRVGYNAIDLAIGAYHDIVETKLLTLQEYVSSTNEQQNDVKRRLETAQIIIDFLAFMNVPKQYHIAREMQVYSVFFELVPLLKRCETDEARQTLKNSVFSNVMMSSFDDQRKYIRSVKSMMDSGLFSSYIKRQQRIYGELQERKESFDIKNEQDLKAFVRQNEEIKEDLQISLDRSLTQSKKAQTRNMPSQLVGKSISTLMDIDTRIIDKLSDSEREKLGNQLRKLSDTVSLITGEVNYEEDKQEGQKASEEKTARLFAAVQRADEPTVVCEKTPIRITNLGFSLPFTAERNASKSKEAADCIAYFTDESYEQLCPLQQFAVHIEDTTRVSFALNAAASSLKHCYLVVRYASDAYNEARLILDCEIKISFQVDFDF